WTMAVSGRRSCTADTRELLAAKLWPNQPLHLTPAASSVFRVQRLTGRHSRPAPPFESLGGALTMAYAVPRMPPPPVVLASAPRLKIHAEVRWLFVPTPDTLDPRAKSLLLDCAACITADRPPFRQAPRLDAPGPPEFQGWTAWPSACAGPGTASTCSPPWPTCAAGSTRPRTPTSPRPAPPGGSWPGCAWPWP